MKRASMATLAAAGFAGAAAAAIYWASGDFDTVTRSGNSQGAGRGSEGEACASAEEREPGCELGRGGILRNTGEMKRPANPDAVQQREAVARGEVAGRMD